MSLSIIPIVQPLYNVYRTYSEVQIRYGNDVYVDALINDKAKTKGAPATTVKLLADVYCETLLTLYNLRVAIAKRAESEIGIALFYAIIASIFVVLICIAVIWGAIVSYTAKLEGFLELQKNWETNNKGRDAVSVLKMEEEKDLARNVMIINISAFGVAAVFIMIIVWIAYVRKRDAVEKVNNVAFKDAALFGDTINNCVPATFLMSDLKENNASLRYLKYNVVAQESGRYTSLANSGFFESYTLPSGVTSIRPIEDKIKTLPKNTLAMVVIIAFVLRQRGMNIDTSVLSKYVKKLPFPGFEGFEPSKLLREIQQVDLVGQVNRLGDAVFYFKELLKKNPEAMAPGSVNRDQVVNDIKAIFTEKAAISKSLVPSFENPKSVVKKNIGSAEACIETCRGNKACAFSVFDSKSGQCAVITEKRAKDFPLFYVMDANKNKTFNTFVKDGADIYVAHPGDASKLENLAKNMKYLHDAPKNTLEAEHGCLLDAKSGECLKANYEGINGEANYVGAFADSTFKSALAMRGSGRNNFTIRTSSTNIINDTNASIQAFEKNRELYMQQVIGIVRRHDPKLSSFIMEDTEASVIAKDVGGQFEGYSNDMTAFVRGILKELPGRLEKAAAELNAIEPDPRDSKYVTGTELLNKIRSMTEYDFVGNFCTHSCDLFACSQGLSKLQNFYDYTLSDLNRGKVLLMLLMSVIIIEGIIFLVYFYLTTEKPYTAEKDEIEIKFKAEISKETDAKKRKGLEKQKNQAVWSHFFDQAMKYVAIAAIILVVAVAIQVSADRAEGIGMYNYEVMKRNGDELKIESTSLIDHLLVEINRGAIMKVPKDSEFRKDVVKNDNRIHLIDAFKDNIGLFSNKSKVVVKDVDGTYIRNKLADIVEAHDKCNALLFGANISMPFPVYEVSIYAFLIALVLVCWLILTFKLEPAKNFKLIKYWKQIRENKDRGLHITKSELNFNDRDVDDLDDDNNFIIKILMLIVVPATAVIFSSQLLQSTNALQNSLYGSNLYRTSTCYTV